MKKWRTLKKLATKSSWRAGRLCSLHAPSPRREAPHTAGPRPGTPPPARRKHAAAPRQGLRRPPAAGAARPDTVRSRHGAVRREAARAAPSPPTAPAPLTLPRPWRSRWVLLPPGFLLQIQTQAAPVSGAGRPAALPRPAPAAMPRRPRGFKPGRPQRHHGYSPPHRRQPPAKEGGGPSARRSYSSVGPQRARARGLSAALPDPPPGVAVETAAGPPSGPQQARPGPARPGGGERGLLGRVWVSQAQQAGRGRLGLGPTVCPRAVSAPVCC